MAKRNTILGDDPRNSKLLGILCLFLALYLFIAFTSYLFTWEEDSSLVWRFSWDLFAQDIRVSNWLGRLGAIVSNWFFYWLFGLPSFFIVYILLQYGVGVLSEKSLGRYTGRFQSSMLWMISLSVLFGYLFSSSRFPWGGNFGKSVSDWLTNFVGVFGVAILILFVLAALIVWTFNPELKGLTADKAWAQFRSHYLDFWDKRYTTAEAAPVSKPIKKKPFPALNGVGEDAAASLAPIKAGEKTALEEALGAAAGVEKPGVPSAATMLEEDLPLSKTKAPSLKAGDATLEIEETPVATHSEETGAVAEPFKLPQPVGIQTNLFGDERGDPTKPYDPTSELSGYEYPVLPLLDSYEDQKVEIDRSELEQNKDQIIETLLNYKIEITKIRATIGPTVTLYEIIPAPGVRISRIKNLEDDIALSLAALGIRIIAPIPGKGTIGIEVPNKNKQIVSLREALSAEKFRKSDMELPIALGKTISNEVFVADLAKMPHLLIAGATGQGKSVGINTILLSLLYKKHPSQLKLVLIDPKKVELSPYSKIENHFLAYLPDQLEPIITDTAKVVNTLNSLCIEMDQRYDLLKKAQARNIKEYNEKFVGRRLNPEKGHRYLPFIVLVIDEFADLIMTAGKEIELPIGRLAQLARAVGIHLIIATQRPSVNIITGVIKANFPARLAFKVTSRIDSRTILDNSGAEQLIGRGDMLISAGADVVRLQCAFVDTPEVERVVDFINQQPGFATPYFLPEYKGDEETHGVASFNLDDIDDMLDDAARLVVQNQHGSTSMIQRRLKLGYNRAGRIMDQLEHLGVVGPNEGSKPREVLFHDDAELERFLSNLRSKKF